MKNNKLILISAILLMALMGLAGSVTCGMSQNPSKAARGIQIPPDLNRIFTNSCMPCHSTHGRELARVVLNFTKWENYGRRAQVQKSRSICRMLTKGEMPPAPFRESNPDLVPTKAQKAEICNWVGSLTMKK